MMRNQDVAYAFARGHEAQAGHIYTDGRVIYSYGTHFPIAIKASDGRIYFNEDKYSVTTSCHQSLVRGAIGGSWDIVESNTEEMKAMLSQYPSRVITPNQLVAVNL